MQACSIYSIHYISVLFFYLKATYVEVLLPIIEFAASVAVGMISNLLATLPPLMTTSTADW